MDQANTKIERFATTVHCGFNDSRYAKRAMSIPVPQSLDLLPTSKFRLWDELTLFFRVLKAARKEKAILLFSSRGYLKPELIATIIIGLWPKRLRPSVVFYGEMFQPNPGIRSIIERLAMQLVNRAVTIYAVYSKDDCEVFSQNWGISTDRIRICPYYTVHTRNDQLPTHQKKGCHVFAGGNSFRDYRPLIDAARQLPDTEFFLCTTKLPKDMDCPPNVMAGPVPYEEYQRLMDTSAAVVVPLEMGTKRSAGMLTYLEAMWSQKPIIVSTALGVHEYINNNETGILTDGTPDGYVTAIRWVFDPKNQTELRAMVERAHHDVVEKYTLENHITALLLIMDEAIRNHAGAAAGTPLL